MPQINTHLYLAHSYWQTWVKPGDTVVDATCGNGHDTLALAHLALTPSSGAVIACDIQPIALKNTLSRLQEHLPQEHIERCSLHLTSHASLPSLLTTPPSLIVYNLGYLPAGDKALTTTTATTLESLEVATSYHCMISVMCYPGHPEGAIEEKAILQWACALPRSKWICCHHQWIQNPKAPSLLLLTPRLV